VDQAHDLGELRAGDAFSVVGRASAGEDPFDGFSFRAPHRVVVIVTLRFDAGGSDLELALHEPTSMQFVETFPAPSSPATAVFHAKGSADLVVRCLSGETDYDLGIVVQPIGPRVDEREPNDDPTQAQYVGEVVVGDAITFRGGVSAASDPLDGLLVACPEAVRITAGLTMPAFTDLDLEFLDATADLASPAPLATFSTGASPETGSLDVAAGRLLLVRARAVTAAGTYDLTLSAAAVATTSAPSHAVRIASESQPGHVGAFASSYGRPASAFVPGEVLVRWRRGREAAGAERVRRRFGRLLEASPSGVHRVAFDLPHGADETEAARFTWSRARGLLGDEAEYAEPNRRRFATAEPDDTYYNVQWNLRMIRAPQAWDRTTGEDAVVVAVLDTGRANHPDLAGRQFGGYDFISDAEFARDGDGRDPDPTDAGDLANYYTSSFHGTHVAGILGATTNNGVGIAGVTWRTRIMHLRVLGVYGGTDSDIAEAIRYAAGLSNASGVVPTTPARVINMSLGAPGFSQTIQDAVTAARAAGVVIFAAAGNSNSTGSFYPASAAGVVSVVAVDSTRARAPYSNYGPTADVSAPGGNEAFDVDGDGVADSVLSTLMNDGFSPPAPIYKGYVGTSMACPHAAGVAALVLAVDPTLTPDQVEALLLSTAEDLGSIGRDDTFGHGLVNASAAVAAAVVEATPGPPPPPEPPALSLDPTSVVLSDARTTWDVHVQNTGGGLLTVGPLEVTTESGGDWLEAVLVGPSDATRTARVVRLTLDRAGLPPGTYLGRVVVSSDGGEGEIDVLATVGTALPPLPDVDVRVRAVRVDTGEIVQEATVNPTTGLDWSFPTLPAGDYVFLAVSDFDRDGTFCEDGDFCGAFPVPNQPEVVTVLANTLRSGVDFRVILQRTFD
jgi:serine protease